MILWEEESLNDREKIFEFLYDFNPDAAEKTDDLIEAKVENLLEHSHLAFCQSPPRAGACRITR